MERHEPISIDEVLKYLRIKEALEQIKTAEAVMRRALVARIRNINIERNKNSVNDKKFEFSGEGQALINPDDEDLGSGEFEFSLIAEMVTNIGLDKESLSEDYDDLPKDEKKAIKEFTDYKIVPKEYKKLMEQYEDGEIDEPEIFNYITEKPGMPKLNVKLNIKD